MKILNVIIILIALASGAGIGLRMFITDWSITVYRANSFDIWFDWFGLFASCVVASCLVIYDNHLQMKKKRNFGGTINSAHGMKRI